MDASFLAYSEDLILNKGASSAKVELALWAMIECLMVMQITLPTSIALRGAIIFHNPTSNKLEDVATGTFRSKFMGNKPKFIADFIDLMVLNFHKFFEFCHTIMSIYFTPVEGYPTLGASLFEILTNFEVLVEVLTEYATTLQFCTPIGANEFGVETFSNVAYRILVEGTFLTDSLTLLMKTFEPQSIQMSGNKLIQLCEFLILHTGALPIEIDGASRIIPRTIFHVILNTISTRQS